MPHCSMAFLDEVTLPVMISEVHERGERGGGGGGGAGLVCQQQLMRLMRLLIGKNSC